MKKVILISLLSFAAFMSKAQDKPYTIVVTASILDDMTQNIIAGEDEVVKCIVPIGADPHLYDPTPADAKLVADADLIIVNGLTFEGWVNELIANSGTKAKVITATDGIKPITSATDKNSTDPHAWMDVTNVIAYINNIKNALVEARPQNKEMYEFNHGVYKQTLEELDTYVMEQMKTIPKEKRILITSHDAFKYYGKRYGIRLEAVLGTSTDAEAQTSDIIRLNKIIEESKIPALFVESTINPKLLKELAKSNDIKIGGELFADSLGDKESEASTFVDMIRHNTDVIVKALSRKVGEGESVVEASSEGSSMTNYITWGVLGLLLLGGFLMVFTKMNK